MGNVGHTALETGDRDEELAVGTICSASARASHRNVNPPKSPVPACPPGIPSLFPAADADDVPSTPPVRPRRDDTTVYTSSYSIVLPTGADGGLNRLRAGHLDAHPQAPSDGSTLVQSGPAAQVPRVQVTASGTLVSQHGRIENASQYGELEDAFSEAYQHYQKAEVVR